MMAGDRALLANESTNLLLSRQIYYLANERCPTYITLLVSLSFNKTAEKTSGSSVS